MVEWLPEWLFEGRLTVYAALGVALCIMLVIWKQTPRTSYLVTCGVLIALIGIYYLLDILVETDREQITHAFQEMSAGVQAGRIDRIFSNVSDTYNRHGQGKEAFRSASEAVIRGGHVEEVRIWGWEYPPVYKEKEQPSDQRENIAHVRFMVKPVRGSEQGLYSVEAVMHRDADGHWRLQSWEAYDPFHETTNPLAVPSIP